MEREDVKDIVVKFNTFNTDSFQKLFIQQDYSKKRQQHAEIRSKEFYYDNLLTDDELLNLSSDQPIICRLNPYEAMTTVFFTNKYFGIGNAKHHKPGIIPIT